MNISNDLSFSDSISSPSDAKSVSELKEKIHEEKRIRELDYYEIIHTDAEKQYDEITKLASYICGKPISLINLIHINKAWVKSKFGVEGVKELNRSEIFCNLTIKSKTSEVLEIKDSSSDLRRKLLDIPESKEFPYKYYAGFPLKTPRRFNIGTLCVLDTQPGEMSKEQKNALKILALQVMKMIELNKRNKELKQAGEKILSLAKIKQDFFSNISHELRSPLNAIYGFTELLSEEDANLNLNKQQKEYVEIIKTNIENLIVIINDILDFSKIESGKFRLDEAPFSLKETLNSVAKLFMLKAESKGLQFSFEYDKGIESQLLGDKVRIYQILVNLLGNSLKFTEKGFLKLRIKRMDNADIKLFDDVNENEFDFTFNPREYDFQNILFSIEDSGIGISADQGKRLFERFEQADEKINTKYGGTGLGLNIVKSLVTLQGGQINVKSEIGKGSTFYFNLKLKRCGIKNFSELKENLNIEFKEGEKKNQIKENKIKDMGKIKNQNFEKFRNNKQIKILLMEDISVNIKYFQKIFEKKDYLIDTVDNGKRGIDLIKSKNNIDYYDIIFMDLNMPEMNGFQTAKILRESLKCKSKIWAMTSNNCEDEKNYCYCLGMDDYITKPIHKKILYEKIENYIQEKLSQVSIHNETFGKMNTKEEEFFKEINENEGGLNNNKPFYMNIKMNKNKESNLNDLSFILKKDFLDQLNKKDEKNTHSQDDLNAMGKVDTENNTSLFPTPPQRDKNSSLKISVINNYKINIYQSEKIGSVKIKETKLEDRFNAKLHNEKFKTNEEAKRNSINRDSKQRDYKRHSKLYDCQMSAQDRMMNILNYHKKDYHKQNELFKSKIDKSPKEKESKESKIGIKEYKDLVNKRLAKLGVLKNTEKNLKNITDINKSLKDRNLNNKDLGDKRKLSAFSEKNKSPVKIVK